ncbi:MAG: HK97-gp10 family putative phage morphogenesis protein [Nanoarchaeota archaeon]|nr:HK97-gp10 family putative phage morphogenesis protein [Nanoarchaeota archaeon]
MELKVDYTDWIKSTKRFKKLNRVMSDDIKITNKEMAVAIRDKARSRAPDNTGALKAAIVYLKVGDGSRYRVVSNKPAGQKGRSAPYNVYQEMGVAANPSYAFVPGHGMVAIDKSQGQYAHRGFTGKRFMNKAFKWAEKEYPNRMKTSVRRTISKVLGGK